MDNAIYVDGRRTEEPGSLQETYEAVRQRRGVAWIALYKPTEEEFGSMVREFGLHPLAVEDPIKAPPAYVRRWSSARSTPSWGRTSW